MLVTFAAGYIAGVFCAIVSHPADTVVSKLNQAKGASAFDVAKQLGWSGKIDTFQIIYISRRNYLLHICLISLKACGEV